MKYPLEYGSKYRTRNCDVRPGETSRWHIGYIRSRSTSELIHTGAISSSEREYTCLALTHYTSTEVRRKRTELLAADSTCKRHNPVAGRKKEAAVGISRIVVPLALNVDKREKEICVGRSFTHVCVRAKSPRRPFPFIAFVRHTFRAGCSNFLIS